MYCNQCGCRVGDGAGFCENCGAQLPAASASEESRASHRAPRQPLQQPPDGAYYGDASPQTAPPPAAREQRIGKNIVLCPDGKYRWVYELNLFQNPTIFLLLWKIFFFIFLGLFLIIIISDFIQWGGWDNVLTNLKIFGYFMIGMTAVVGLSYCIYAAIMGGKYCVIFEMDEQGVNHKQMPKQAKKAELISAITMFGGLASGSLTAVGIGMNVRTEMYSAFEKTRKVKAYPRRGLIKVNGLLNHNQVYAGKEDFEFVKDFILSHCVNLK
ncbi:MAG: zinc ribbon domain-containing protein [Clostridia bacterium]|nr:zinc ribbon domain-containing protein [Clostridia bacterium]